MRVTKVIAQIDLAAASDHTPGLLLWEGQANVPSKAVLTLLLERATTEVNKPGGRTKRDAAPAISPIDAAITNAEQVSRRTGVAAEGSPLEAEKNQPIKQHLFGARAAPSGKIRWIAEMKSMIAAIAEMKDAPAAVAAMTPMLQDALAQLEAAQPLAPGRTSESFMYSEEAANAVLAVELGVGVFRSWSAAMANPTRYGLILRAISPRRQTDAKPGAPAQGTGPVVPSAAAAGTPASVPASTAAHSIGATSHDATAVTATP